MKKTLANYYLVSSLLFSVLLISIIIGVFQATEQSFLKNNIEEVRENILDNYKDEIKTRIELVEQYINAQNDLSEERLRKSVTERVNEAHTIATTLYKTYKDEKSLEEIKHIIKEALREIRFFDGRGYYFIDDLEGNCVLYPLRPSIEGKNILHFQDINKKYVIQDFVNIAKEKNEGFSTYWTYKYKYKEEGKRYKKVAFIKKFEPLNWLIGVGEYVADVERDIKKEIARDINSYRVAENSSYVNVFEVHDFNGGEEFATIVVNPNRTDLVGKKISSYVEDADGKQYRQEFLKQVNLTGEGFYTYKYTKIDSFEHSSKLGYAKKLKHWNWVLSTGVHLDKLDELTAKSVEHFKMVHSHNQTRMWTLIAGAFIILVVLTFLISKRIQLDLGQVRDIFASATQNKEKIKFNKFFVDDFKHLAAFANKMIEKIQLQQDDLERANIKLESRVSEKTKELSEANHFLEEKNRLQEMTYITDALTGLGNRNAFARDIADIKHPTLMIIDIDGFKNINDFYGIKTGDVLLVALAYFIKEFITNHPLHPTAYRLSSDEFLLMIDHEVSLDMLRPSAEKFVSAIAKQNFVDHTETTTFSVDVTCGIASDTQSVLSKADIALNYAKRKKLDYAIYDASNMDMDTHKRNLYWREKVQRAINNDLVEPYFQPIVNINDPKASKYETLMRIVDGDEVITPYAF